MNAIEDLTEKFQSGILESFPSQVFVDGLVTRIITVMNGYTVEVEITKYNLSEMDAAFSEAGLVGSLRLHSRIQPSVKSNMDTYKKLIEEYTRQTDSQVWASRLEAPRGYAITGLTTGMQVIDLGDSYRVLSKEALMTSFYSFCNATNDYLDFVLENVAVKS